jgi:hypothetical protein
MALEHFMLSDICRWCRICRCPAATLTMPLLCGLLCMMCHCELCNAVQVDGRPLAAKPDLTSLLRCRWAAGLQLQAPFVLKAASDVAVSASCAAAFLHCLLPCTCWKTCLAQAA